jgi:hypothetical protein
MCQKKNLRNQNFTDVEEIREWPAHESISLGTHMGKCESELPNISVGVSDPKFYTIVLQVFLAASICVLHKILVLEKMATRTGAKRDPAKF